MAALQLAFLNVGQGDTTIIYDLDTRDAVVVDCVNPLPVLEFLKTKGLSRLRALIVTHAHLDHYAGTVSLLENCEQQGISWDTFIFRWEDVRRYPSLLNDADGHSGAIDGMKRDASLRTLLKWAKRPEIKKKHAQPHDLPRNVRILDALTFLHPEHRDWQELFDTSSLNNLSVVIRVSDGASALLAGDIEPEGWRHLSANHPQLLTNAILKFPHHGVWRNGNIAELLDQVAPEIVIISVGMSNAYQHPSKDVFAELRKRPSIRLLCTQATPQCSDRLREVREKILTAIERAGSSELLGSDRREGGCPCAGTVLIELGDKAKVLSPSLQLHITEIIQPFLEKHQCILPSLT
ncbi:MAG TPA: MBL fold metallo-hydrolase [Anaerolineales bacterium]|nr:MBL fold metallo-hydrolase [Anaerolineales bacterium]